MEQTFPAIETSIAQISEFFIKEIKESKINEKLCAEYELLLEELTIKIISSAKPGSEITVEVKKRLGTIYAKMKCPGSPVLLDSESGTDYSGQIIREYGESLRQSYSSGINEIIFTTSYSSNEIMLNNMVSLGVALVIGILFRLIFSSSQQELVSKNILMPVIMIFVRSMQMVAIPVAFFSLVDFVVKIRRTFDSNNKTIRLGFHYVVSSIIAIAIGVLTWFAFRNMANECDLTSYKTLEDNFIGSSLKDFLTQIVSSNIIEPFIISNPLPFLVNALLTGLAASSVFGKSGDVIRNVLSAIKDLFARMMNIIYRTIPFFLFIAVFDLVIRFDVKLLLTIGIGLSSVITAMVLLVIYYLIRLVFGRVNVISFFKSYTGLLIENIKIASNMDSFPYNKRILARKMSLSRDFLSEGLKLGILLNMDGNCLTVTVVLLNMITAAGVEVTAMKYVGIALIMFLFSVGAPNLPGSFLLGMIILMSFVGLSDGLVGTVLILEAIIAKLYSFLNAAGDIVTLAVEDARNQRVNSMPSNNR